MQYLDKKVIVINKSNKSMRTMQWTVNLTDMMTVTGLRNFRHPGKALNYVVKLVEQGYEVSNLNALNELKDYASRW